MKIHSVFLAVLAGGLLSVNSVQSAEMVWKNPVAPGANSATSPAPRDEWFSRVQHNFDVTQGNHYDLIFDGDSITDFWQTTGKEVWDRYYAPLNATDFGISGDRTEQVLWRLGKGQVDGMSPKLVVLMIGTNNLSRNNADQIAGGVRAIVQEYLKRCPESHILLLGIFPRATSPNDPQRAKIKEINKSISTLADARVTYLDIGEKFLEADGTLSKAVMPDALHPSSKGYQIWADAIAPEIEKYFPSAKK